MTLAEKISFTRTLVENDSQATDEILTVYIKKAESAIRLRMYPFGKDSFEVPGQYEVLQCELAARYFLRRGGEGEITHSENGISRRYDSVNDEDLLSEVVQQI